MKLFINIDDINLSSRS